jgi:hypothetical protein
MTSAAAVAATSAVLLATGCLTGIAAGQEANETICVQGTYSIPCPKVIWCPAQKCGIGLARADGNLDIIYSSEPRMVGMHRRPIYGGIPMSLQHVAGRVLVFEWTDSGELEKPGADLGIKDVLYAIMPPPNTG